MTVAPASAALIASRRLLRWVTIALAMWLSGAGAFAHAQQQARIGYIDLKRLLDNAPQMASTNERLREEFAERDRRLKTDEARLAELQEKQRRESGMTTADVSEALSAEIDALDRKIRRTRETLRDELRRRSEEETELRWREINEAVAAYARENAYDLITHGPVFYASPSIDITDQVLARLREHQATVDDNDD